MNIYSIYFLLLTVFSYCPPENIRIGNDTVNSMQTGGKKKVCRKTKTAVTFKDSIIFQDAALYWAKGTGEIRERVFKLRNESVLFSALLDQLEQSEYPFLIRLAEMENIGEFSSLYGEIRFNTSKMTGFLKDAAIIEEFVHAFQSAHYEYSHGQCRKKDYLFALKDAENEVKFKNKFEKGFMNWRRFGTKSAFIESEAKLITYLIQHQSASVSIKSVIDTDIYNSGGAASAYILPYLNRRNCTRMKKQEKLAVLSDLYIDLETFMRYQQAFILYWKFEAPKSSYTKGKLRHRPEALQALSRYMTETY